MVIVIAKCEYFLFKHMLKFASLCYTCSKLTSQKMVMETLFSKDPIEHIT